MIGWLNLLFVLALAVLAVLFASANQREVTIQLPGGWRMADVPLFVLAFVPLFLGFLAGTISAWNSRWALRRQSELLQSQNQKLEAELANLRNQPLDNDLHVS
ncbi:MAG: LapA family protein [Magnetococcales bacterium]|nr:LapA family protein [Magnetococcales bacterium]